MAIIDIQTQTIGPVTLFEVTGRMDAAARDTLMQAVDRELSKIDRQIIFNLAGVDYISTSGLKVLRRVHETTGRVRIAGPSARVRDVLQMTGLDATYTLFENNPAAIHHCTPVVNAHTHLEQGWLEDHRPGVRGASFAEWFAAVGVLGNGLGDALPRISQVAAERGVQALIDAGATTVCDISATGASIEPLLKSGLRGVIYVEVIGQHPERAQDSFNRARTLIDKWRPKQNSLMRLGLAIHAPYSVSRDLWRQAIDYARAESLPVSIHAAESAAEVEAMRYGTGPLADRVRARGVAFDAPGKSPVAFLDEIGALALKPQLVHCVHVDDDDLKRIAASGCTVVHCPRSNLRLRAGRMPLEKFLAAEVPVYLGTDSLGSSPSLNVLDEMEIAAALHHGHVAPDVIESLAHRPLVV